MKRHGCLRAYILYIILYLVYFIIIGKIISLFFPNLQSETDLAIVLFVSALFSILTVLIINKRNSIRKLLHLWKIYINWVRRMGRWPITFCPSHYPIAHTSPALFPHTSFPAKPPHPASNAPHTIAARSSLYPFGGARHSFIRSLIRWRPHPTRQHTIRLHRYPIA